MAAPKVLILKAPGTNCDEETAVAWSTAGASPETRHIASVLESPESLDAFQILTIPGGFSFGDDLGAGRVFALEVQARLNDAIARLLDRGGLVLGICNGFQVLVKTGWLPGGTHRGRVTLARNQSGHFEDRWVRLGVLSGRTPFLADDAPIELPAAHGEGRFVPADDSVLQDLERGQQLVLRYLATDGTPTGEFPANPNGSVAGVAGVCDPTGRILGLMPHPERNILRWHHPRWTREERPEHGDGLRLFQNACRYFA